ncbi:MAG: hypothetical protein RMM53_08125, partial [Bacteroidia bacterium]|nr:hypothetical protein [Bacteroidia bacterium]
MTYHDAEQKIKKEEYIVYGNDPPLKIGIYKEYYSNGKLRSVLEYRWGRLWNILEQYDSNGNRLKKSEFSNGTGVLTIYTPSGEPFVQIEMLHGQPSGKISYRFANKTFTWSDGLPLAIETESMEKTGEEQVASSRDSIKIVKSGFDIAVADVVLKNLSSNNLKAVYNQSYGKLKETQTLAQFERYWNFITKAYGKLKDFRRVSYQLTSIDDSEEGLEVIYECNF